MAGQEKKRTSHESENTKVYAKPVTGAEPVHTTEVAAMGAESVKIYDKPDAHTTPVPAAAHPVNTTHTTVATAPNRAVDLVRWGSVLAGLFAALATLITLGVLGLAIGSSTYNYGDPLRNVGIGAGIWGAISALIAFGVGGWLAGRSAADRGHNSGIFNGAMVWFVAIPLLIYALGSGIGAIARTAGGVAGTAAEVASNAVGSAANVAASNPALQGTAQAGANNPALQGTVQAGATGLQQAAQATAQSLQQQAPEIANRVAEGSANTAWGTLLSLGLAAAAAVGGGYAGSRMRNTTVQPTTAPRRA